jgi:uncharacterized protein (DUF1778 family)
MPTVTRRRADRLDLRLTEDAKQLLKQAADAQRKTVSAFLLDSGLAAAAEALVERRGFSLGTRDWNAFVKALDAPANPKPRLRALLSTPSALE